MFHLYRNYTITEKREFMEKRQQIRNEMQRELDEITGKYLNVDL
jgi:hypothetical protein